MESNLRSIMEKANNAYACLCICRKELIESGMKCDSPSIKFLDDSIDNALAFILKSYNQLTREERKDDK